MLHKKLLALCLTVLCTAFATTAFAYRGNLEDVTLNATAEKQLSPDMAYVNFTIETKGSNSREAVQLAANKAAAVKRNLLGLAFTSDMLEQVHYSVNPVFNEKGKTVAYITHNALKIKVEDLSKLGSVIDNLADSGIDRLDNIDFSVKNKEYYQQQLLRDAVVNARTKAQIIAEAGNRSLGRLLSVKLNSYTPMMRFNNSMAMAKMASVDEATVIEPKSITIRAEVEAAFALE